MNTYIDVNAQLTEFEEANTLDVYRAVMRIRQKLYAISTAVAKNFDLHSSEMALLDTLGKYGPLTMGHLAEISFSSAANASYTVQGLEKRGLVKRERSVDSHRVVNVTLTLEGEKTFKKTYVQTVQAVNGYLAEDLTDAERKTLLELLYSLSAVQQEEI